MAQQAIRALKSEVRLLRLTSLGVALIGDEPDLKFVMLGLLWAQYRGFGHGARSVLTKLSAKKKPPEGGFEGLRINAPVISLRKRQLP